MAHRIVLRDGEIIDDGGLKVVKGRHGRKTNTIEMHVTIVVPEGDVEFVVMRGTEHALLCMAAANTVKTGSPPPQPLDAGTGSKLDPFDPSTAAAPPSDHPDGGRRGD